MRLMEFVMMRSAIAIASLCGLTLQAGAFPIVPASPDRPRVDLYGDPLPERAIARLGSARFRHPGAVHAVAFSPDGKLVAASSDDRCMIRVWHRATGELQTEWAVPGHLPPHQLAFAKDSRRLFAFAHQNPEQIGMVYELGKTRGRACGPFQSKGMGVICLSADATEMLVGDGVKVVRWDLDADREVGRYTYPAGDGILAATIVPDFGPIAVSYKGGAFLLTKLDDGKVQWLVDGVRDRKVADHPAALSADGKRVAICVGLGRIGLINTKSGEVAATITFNDARGAQHLRMSPDGKSLGVCSGLSLRLFNLPAGTERAVVGTGFTASTDLFFAPDSRVFATGGANNPHGVLLRDTATGKSVDPVPGEVTPIRTLAFSPDGSRIATGSFLRGDQRVMVWDAETGHRLMSIDGPRGIGEVNYSPDGSLLAANGRGAGNTVRIWNARTGERVRDLGPNPADCLCLAFSRDGRLLASGDYPAFPTAGRFIGRLRIWDVEHGELVREIDGSENGIDRVAFSADGRHVIVGGQGVHIFDLETGKPTAAPLLPKSRILGMSLSPDGRLLATAEMNGPVRVWELLTQLEIRGWDATHDCQCAVFSADGRLVACSTSEGTLLREISTDNVLLRIPPGPTRDYVVTLSRDGKRLATAGNQESTATVWNVADIVNRPRASQERVSAKDLESWWISLADADAKVGYAAVWKFAASGDAAVEFLENALRRPAADAAKIQRLIAELDDTKYPVRELAMRELAVLGDEAVGPLREARKGKPSAEQVKRIDDLLAKLAGPRPSPERLRVSRGIAVLEQIGGAKARAALEALADPKNTPLLVQEARAALDRSK
jgi:WD40 repeat protein